MCVSMQGNYDRLEAMLASKSSTIYVLFRTESPKLSSMDVYELSVSQTIAGGLEPVDLLLLMACSENDTPKVEELLKAGADISVKDLSGKSPLELCKKEEIREMLEAAMARK